MKYLKLFRKHVDYQQFINGAGGKILLPNISVCKGIKGVYYKPLKPNKFSGIINATDTSTNYPLFSGSTVSMDNIKYMKIDDVEVTPISSTTFTTTGEHTYEVKLNEPMTNARYMFYNCRSLTSLDLSKWDTSNVTNMSIMFYDCRSLTSLNLSKWNTSNVTNMREMFYNCRSLTSLDLNKWDVSKVTSMYQMFNGCSGLTSLDLNNWDTSNVTDMKYMFQNCKSLTSLDLSNWDVSNVTDMGDMFNGCSGLTSLDLNNWDTSNVTHMSNMFQGCQSLTSLDLSNWDVSKVTSMYQMFEDCKSLISLDLSNWDTSNVITMSEMFRGCSGLTSLDLSNWDTSKVTNMSNMFWYCSGLTSLHSISNWDTSKVTNMSDMFLGCISLTSLDLSNWDTSNVTNMSNMFYDCESLTSLDLSNWDTSKVTHMSDMFRGCESLSEVKMGGNLSNLINVNRMFTDINTNGTFYYNPQYDYSKIIAVLPSTWTALPMVENIRCIELTITAEDVSGRATSTPITYTATLTGNSIPDGSVITWTETGTGISDEFEQNLSETESRQVEVSFTYEGKTVTTTITQGVWVNVSYNINLNNQWQLSSTISNPDSSTYEGVYESYSNKGINNSAAIMNIDIVGYETFKLYIRSYAESNYDYVMVSQLDQTITSGSSYSDITLVKAHTRGSQSSGTAIGNYKLVEFTGIDGGEHRITVLYRKDSSSASGDDRGYLLIPKNQ